MSKYFILTKALYKNGSGYIFNSKNKKKSLLFMLIMAVALMPMAIGIGSLVWYLYDGMAKLKLQGAILEMGFSLVSAAVFFFGIFYVISVFYFAKDLDDLLPLPLKPHEILLSKLTVALFYEYFTEAIFLIPIIISFGIKSGGGILYYLYSILVFLTLPIIPLIYAAVIIMLIMRFTNLAKNKDRFRTWGGVFGLFIAIGINIYFQKLAQGNIDSKKLQEMILRGDNSAIKFSSMLFPHVKQAANALVSSISWDSLISLGEYFGLLLLFVIIFSLLGELLYFRGVLGISETASKRKVLNEKEIEKATIRQSPIRAFILKELRILFRTPAYFLNCILMNFLWPLFVAIPVIVKPDILGNFMLLKKLIGVPVIAGAILSGTFAYSMFLGASNSITSTAISREGQNIFVNKFLPISYKKQILAKIISGAIMSMASILLMIVILSILMRPQLYFVALVIIVSVLGIILSSFIGILIDLNFPKLDWDSEQKAVKQNFNVMINILVSTIIGVASMFGIMKFALPTWHAFILLVTVFSIIDFVLYKILTTKGVALFKKINA